VNTLNEIITKNKINENKHRNKERLIELKKNNTKTKTNSYMC